MKTEMEYTQDEQGRDVLLKDGKFQVMMQWEKPYMEACIDKLQPKGDVLEIGFGLGYSATHIQTYLPKSHTIIEYHPVVCEKAREWAKEYENVTIVEGTWQEKLPTLGQFDEVFFDDYPLESESEMQLLKQKGKIANALLKSGEKKLKWVQKIFPSISKKEYNTSAIDEFFTLIEGQKNAEPKVYLTFFSGLKKRKQISIELYEYAIARLLSEKRITPDDMKTPVEKQTSFRAPSERLLTCLERCLASHLKTGGKFSCYLNHDASLFDHPEFTEMVLNNPFIDFHREIISVEVPAYCDYFEGNKAQVIVIQKHD